MSFRLFIALILLSCLSGCEQQESQHTLEPTKQVTDESDLLRTGLGPRVRIIGRESNLQTLEQRQAKLNVPGVSMAFMQDGKLAWTLTSGVKDITTEQPLTENTVFQAASISKPAFATVLMKYKQSNPIDLELDVNDLLTSWQLPEHDWSGSEVVTLRRLLSHTAGTTVHGFPGYAGGVNVPTLQQVLNGVEPANTAEVVVDIKPNTQYRYSGGGTTIAQLTLQDVSGMNLTPMAEDLLFGPLEMSRSGFYQPISKELAGDMAVPYRSDGTAVKGGAHTYAALAAAGMWSTPTDLLKLASAVRSAYLGIETDWLSQQSAIDMLTNNAPTAESRDVGIGFFLNISEDGTLEGFGHNGSNEGFQSALYIELKSGDGYAIMVNSDSGGRLISEMETRIAETLDVGDEKPINKTIVEMDKQSLNEYVGSYSVTTPIQVEIILSESDNGFVLNALPYVENQSYWHQGDGAFFALDGGTVRFERNQQGLIKHLIMSNGIDGTRIDSRE